MEGILIKKARCQADGIRQEERENEVKHNEDRGN